ncbi:MAG TPA: M48 family metalloprotease [Gemmataceae bacterium]|nr:M48 family metalloprotease [Gemmataceae bacterium]
MSHAPSPLPYHLAVVDYLKREEADLWKWFSSTRTRSEYADAIRLDLLKSTYRIEPATQPKLYAGAQEVLAKYSLQVPVTFYQAQTGAGMNASLAYIPGEAHIILAGPVLAALSEVELLAVLGHELAHFLLFDQWEGQFLTATELLDGLCNDAAAAPAHVETGRLFRLYSEVFADRGALHASQDTTAAISTLIKMETGLTEVSAESYLRQAEEIFSKSQASANQLTHPESYIRARALKLWADQGEHAAGEIDRMIQGAPTLDRLDLLGQQRVAGTTRRLLKLFLAPAWSQTEPLLAHARLFFSDFAADGMSEESVLMNELQALAPSLRDYYCYVLLDFVAVDRELVENSLASALVLSKRLGFGERFTELAQKELGISKRHFGKIERDAEAIVARASEAEADK